MGNPPPVTTCEVRAGFDAQHHKYRVSTLQLQQEVRGVTSLAALTSDVNSSLL